MSDKNDTIKIQDEQSKIIKPVKVTKTVKTVQHSEDPNYVNKIEKTMIKVKNNEQANTTNTTKQGYLLKLCMSTYNKKQMFGFTRSKIQIPYLFINKNEKHIASEKELQEHKNDPIDLDKTVDSNGVPKQPFIFYPNKRFVYLMYKGNPRLYFETRDIKDGKVSPIYYKQISISWNLTDKQFIRYRNEDKKQIPILSVICKEKDKVASILPGTMFYVNSSGKLIKTEFKTEGKIIINDKRKKYPFDWTKPKDN